MPIKSAAIIPPAAHCGSSSEATQLVEADTNCPYYSVIHLYIFYLTLYSAFFSSDPWLHDLSTLC